MKASCITKIIVQSAASERADQEHQTKHYAQKASCPEAQTPSRQNQQD